MSTRNCIALTQLLTLLAPIGGARAEEQNISVPPGIGNTFTHYPIQILQEQVYSMRYQQVYAASAFAALEPSHRYLTRLDFRVDESSDRQAIGTTTNIEVRLSTTPKAPDALGTNFAENVGADEILVYADTEPTYIKPNVDIWRYVFILPKPFLYDPQKGNLLVEVRVATTGEPLWEQNRTLDANSDPSDAVSRVYANSVNATVATNVDTIGLNTVFHFNPVPTMQVRFESVYGTNRPVVRWPAQPSVFVPQMSLHLGAGSSWRTITSGIGGLSVGGDRWIYLPETPPGISAFYRLIWEDGVPVPPGQTSFGPPPSPPKE